MKQLPQRLDPRKFAHLNAKLAGIVPEDCLSRLHDLSDGRDVQAIHAELEFLVDEQGRRRLFGQISTKVNLVCQRCLHVLPVPVDVAVKLAIVRDEEQAEDLPRDIEPWIVAQEQGDLYLALEEEVLLALPAAAKHDYPCIEADSLKAGPEVSEEALAAEKENPFSVLADLKKNLKTTD